MEILTRPQWCDSFGKDTICIIRFYGGQDARVICTKCYELSMRGK